MSSPEPFRFDDVRLSISGGLRNVVKFLTFLWKNFMQDRVLLSAGSLAFQTLLSLVPLLAVILSVLRVSPVFDSFRLYVEEFIFENFVPASGEIARDYLWQFIDKASSVPTIGGIFLFVIALFLISTIDHTINQIWEIHAPRKFFEGFTLYWTVLTLGPIFIGTSLVATSYVWYHFFMHGPLADMQTRILLTLPVLNSFLAFFLLYILVPKTRVKFVHALSGAVLATLLFELSKKWLSFYVTNLATFEHIYGALSVIPLLFLWIYLIWVVLLTGAEFVYSLGAGKTALSSSTRRAGGLEALYAALSVLHVLDKARQSGRLADWKTFNRASAGLGADELRLVIDALRQAGVIHKTSEGAFAISSDLHTLTLYDLYTSLPPGLPGTGRDSVAGNGFEQVFSSVEKSFFQCLEQNLHQPVSALINSGPCQS
ncbi:hypothetical protein B9H02_04340 [Prosthecochloris sp. HL-130-GSB]|jgi:membrane protein|nr:hypothetical protein B9H02_04340 [Prosthecochloris sp. HL-130-GSB]